MSSSLVSVKKKIKNNLLEQERLLPSYLRHDHPGATALRTSTVFLAPNRRGNATSEVSEVQSFRTHLEPHQQGHPGLTFGPAGRHSRRQRVCGVCVCRRFSGDTAGQSPLNHPDISHSQGHWESCDGDQQHFRASLSHMAGTEKDHISSATAAR